MQTGHPEQRLHCHVKFPYCGIGSVRCYLIAIDLRPLRAQKKKQMVETSNCSHQPTEDNSESLSDSSGTPKKIYILKVAQEIQWTEVELVVSRVSIDI